MVVFRIQFDFVDFGTPSATYEFFFHDRKDGAVFKICICRTACEDMRTELELLLVEGRPDGSVSVGQFGEVERLRQKREMLIR